LQQENNRSVVKKLSDKGYEVLGNLDGMVAIKKSSFKDKIVPVVLHTDDAHMLSVVLTIHEATRKKFLLISGPLLCASSVLDLIEALDADIIVGGVSRDHSTEGCNCLEQFEKRGYRLLTGQKKSTFLFVLPNGIGSNFLCQKTMKRPL